MLMEQIRKGLRLFADFFRIGCFTFGGGWAIVAQMEQEYVDRQKVIDKDELLEMVAVGRSAPGIMITNIALLFGYHVAGPFGGICTVLGICTPAMIILSIVAIFYNSLKDNYWFAAILRGIRCAVVPIIATSCLSLGKQALQTRFAVAVFGVGVVLALFTGVSNVMLVLAGIAAALVYYFAIGRKGGRQA
ncbi:MAG: chromate transporter [Lachnospiraceae bacterium]|nr:chromate transporter [Lachnospiraceae bacterium]